MFGTIGPTELLLLFGILLILFGGKKLPELGRGLGRGIQSFKAGLRGVVEDPEDESSGSEQ